MAKAQLDIFMGKAFTHFSKPPKKFIEKCIYGIQAPSDTKLSSIVHAIDDGIRPASFGAMPVRLPMHPEKELHLVVKGWRIVPGVSDTNISCLPPPFAANGMQRPRIANFAAAPSPSG